MSNDEDSPSDRPVSTNIDLERYRIKYSLYKVIFGTAMVGVISVLVPGAVEYWKATFENQRLTTQYEIENKRKELEIELGQINQQQAYVKDFLETALNQDVELRIRFADYFSNVSADEFRDDWKAYRDALVKTRNTTREEIHAKEEELLKVISIEAPTVDQQIAKARLDRELEWRYREIGYVARDRSIVRSESEAQDSERAQVAVDPAEGLKRIIMHWTAGKHTAHPIDQKHYHVIVEGDGTRVDGIYPPEANIRPGSAEYAAHTRGLNRGSIGVAMAGMRGFRDRPFEAGEAPITVEQLEAFCAVVVELATLYDIPITRETVLTQAEVTRTLGVAQRYKADITWLPGMDAPGDPIEVGDRLRGMMRAALEAAPIKGGQRVSCVYSPDASSEILAE